MFQIVDVNDVPLTYIPGNATRIKVRAIGDLERRHRSAVHCDVNDSIHFKKTTASDSGILFEKEKVQPLKNKSISDIRENLYLRGMWVNYKFDGYLSTVIQLQCCFEFIQKQWYRVSILYSLLILANLRLGGLFFPAKNSFLSE